MIEEEVEEDIEEEGMAWFGCWLNWLLVES
jgi:hypothetical protein